MIANLSVDVGSGVTKWRAGKDAGSLPSAVGPYRKEGFQINGVAQHLVVTDDESFVVGDLANSALPEDSKENTLSQEWAFTAGWRALLYASIAQAFPKGLEGELAICTGLPQAYFADQKDKFVRRLLGDHEFLMNERRYRVTLKPSTTLTIPQAMAVYFAAANEDETLRRDLVGVVDIGTFTAGFSMVEDGRYKGYAANGVEVGIAQLAQRVGDHLSRRHGFRPPLHRLIRGIQRGQIHWEGKEIPLKSKFVEETAEPVADDLVERMKAAWGDHAPEARILVAGGGAPFYLKALKQRFPHAKLACAPEDCWRVIVDGYQIFLEAKLAKEGKKS